ncbi:MAG: rhamnan synthesis F family protein [Planctomycetaceae bacterium]
MNGDPSSPGACEPTSRAIVFAHFDAEHRLDPHVIHALREYRRHCGRLVLVSNGGPAPLPREAAAMVDAYLPRPNSGYDFGAWRDGLASLDRGAYGEVLCVNDSVYGPLTDLGPTLANPRTAGADLWGMVVSEQAARRGGPRLRHVQTWFFGMRRRLLASDVYERFWAAVRPQASKQDVIERYEVGLSRAVAEAGMAVAGIYDAGLAPPIGFAELLPEVSLREPARSWRVVRKGRRVPHNPSELVWWRLLEAGVPFVKVGLLRINHYGVDLRRVLAELDRVPGYDASLVRCHLARCG